MPSIDVVVHQLVADDVPVAFLDTCVLLDVIRAIERLQPNCVRAARELHQAVTGSPKRCNIVISHLVDREWNDNQSALKAQAGRHLARLQDESKAFHDACSLLGVAPAFSRGFYSAYGIENLVHKLSEDLLRRAIQIDGDDACSARAVGRVVDRIPPSNRGREVKDCNILEECLAVCGALQKKGFNRRLVFCTSNLDDYGEVRRLHPILAQEFAKLGLRFTSNLEWAYHDVTH